MVNSTNKVYYNQNIFYFAFNCNFVDMSKENLITGITIELQMSKARHILHNQVIPREELYQIRKREKKLIQSKEQTDKVNA